MSDALSYYVHTFGCRVNQADSAGIAAELEKKDLVRTSSHADAKIVVLNTCTVTHRSDADVRKAVRRVKRDNPGCKVIVTGCYAQREPEALVQLGGVSAVVGNAHKHDLPSVVDRVLLEERAPLVVHSPIDGVDPSELPPVDTVTTVLDRTRPFVKIQDGCDAACTYCIIPAVRGRARSAPVEQVVEATRALVREGYVEVVLAGVHLGTYGAALETPATLVELVEAVLEIEDLRRLRMSCIEPMAFPVELAAIARRDARLAPHFHLPLQSGSDAVLKRMVRPYRAAEFGSILRAIRSEVPHACLGTDVIVGFPGETEAQFEETLRFVEGAGLDYVHVFSYSDRSGTPSTRLGPKVDPRTIKVRATALNRVGARAWRRFLDRQIGATLSAVTLERNDGQLEALADNYAPVRLEEDLPANRLVNVAVLARDGDKLTGRLATAL